MYHNFWQHKMTQNDPCETGFFLFFSPLRSPALEESQMHLPEPE